MPVVVVEIASGEVAPALARELLEACSVAIEDGRCVLSTDEGLADPDALAIVRWEGSEQRRVSIQVALEGQPTPVWQASALEFRDADAGGERWRSVGLTIATLARRVIAERLAMEGRFPEAPRAAGSVNADEAKQRQRAAEATVVAAPHRSPTRAAGRPSSRRPHQEVAERLAVGAGGLFGPGLATGPAKMGGFVEASWKPSRMPLRVVVQGSSATLVSDVGTLDVRWIGAHVGLGAVVPVVGPMAAEARLSFLVVGIGADVAQGGRSDSGSQTLYGAQGDLRVGWAFGPVFPFGGIALWRTDTKTNILVQNRIVGTAPATGFAGVAGLRWKFW